MAADGMQSFVTWVQGIGFSLYGWKIVPVDLKNLIWSYVDKVRTFTPLIDLVLEEPQRGSSVEGKGVLTATNTLLEVVSHKRELLNLPNADQRWHHQVLINKGCKVCVFDMGDIVF